MDFPASRSPALSTSALPAILWFQGLAIGDYLAGRDPVAGTVYLALLGVFAVMPLFVARGRTPEG